MDAVGTVLNAARIVKHYAKRPGKAHELGTWVKATRSTPTQAPWWHPGAVSAVEDHLDATSKVFEYGSGASTLWLAERSAKVVSVEHDRGWFDRMRTDAPPNVDLLFVPPKKQGTIWSVSSPEHFYDEYVKTISTFDEFDLVVIDGRARIACVQRAMSHVRPGGYLLLDDANRQQYQAAKQILTGWHKIDHTGIKPKSFEIVTTAIFSRPR